MENSTCGQNHGVRSRMEPVSLQRQGSRERAVKGSNQNVHASRLTYHDYFRGFGTQLPGCPMIKGLVVVSARALERGDEISSG